MSRRCGVAILAAAVTGLAACGGGSRLPQSPCRSVAPWKGTALRRCAALVHRWAPVRGIRLTAHLPARVMSTCEQARHQVRIPVVCPPLVPAGGVVADPGLYGSAGPAPPDTAGDFYLLTFNNGENAGHAHWIVGAGQGRTVQRELFDVRKWDVPGRVRPLGNRRYGPWTIAFYRFPPHPSGGELGGHDLAISTLGATTYFASVHGWSHHGPDAAMLIAVLLAAGHPR